MTDLLEPAAIRANVEEVQQRIEAAGGSLDEVTIVAVTKAFPVELGPRAIEAGLSDLGENYAQELLAKADHLVDVRSEQNASGGREVELAAARWHFIGGLQRNKVKLLAGRVHRWQTIDRASLVDEVAKRSPGDRILVQVNTTGEAQKSGCDPTETAGLVERARSAGLAIDGLMTIGPTSPAIDPRPSFAQLRELAERCELSQLSMGMSADFELAVAEGSTMIRVGSVLFGPRPSR